MGRTGQRRRSPRNHAGGSDTKTGAAAKSEGDAAKPTKEPERLATPPNDTEEWFGASDCEGGGAATKKVAYEFFMRHSRKESA